MSTPAFKFSVVSAKTDVSPGIISWTDINEYRDVDDMAAPVVGYGNPTTFWAVQEATPTITTAQSDTALSVPATISVPSGANKGSLLVMEFSITKDVADPDPDIVTPYAFAYEIEGALSATKFAETIVQQVMGRVGGQLSDNFVAATFPAPGTINFIGSDVSYNIEITSLVYTPTSVLPPPEVQVFIDTLYP